MTVRNLDKPKVAAKHELLNKPADGYLKYTNDNAYNDFSYNDFTYNINKCDISYMFLLLL